MNNPAASNAVSVLFERDGAVARLTLNRPAAANAIDTTMARELMLAAIRCDEDDSIRCVLLSATGRFFCAGGDIRSFVAAGASIASLLKEMTAYYHMALSRLMRMNKPLVVAVNGTAAGAGFSLAMIGDIVIAGRSAQFTSAYTALGVSSDGGLSWLLPRLVGLRQAQELVMTNRMLSADDALTMKLVTRISENDALAQEGLRAAQELAVGPTRAYGSFRRLLLRSHESSLESHLEEESRSLAETASSTHGQEGISAFIAKRKADFSR
jgi:2-(1,2-epoxy-1,2-dihydrophenyl)acetyl-CoA isomerase